MTLRSRVGSAAGLLIASIWIGRTVELSDVISSSFTRIP